MDGDEDDGCTCFWGLRAAVYDEATDSFWCPGCGGYMGCPDDEP